MAFTKCKHERHVQTSENGLSQIKCRSVETRAKSEIFADLVSHNKDILLSLQFHYHRFQPEHNVPV